jgi:CRP-like cAMP-binding protein
MLEFIAGCARNVRVKPNEYLFREDQRADTLYLLRRGRINLDCHVPGRGRVTLESLSAPEALGATALLAPYVWHLNARATTPVLAFALDGRCLRRKVSDDPAFGCALLSMLLRDVHGRLTHARLAQLDVYQSRSVP